MLTILTPFIFSIFPRVKKDLNSYKNFLLEIPCKDLEEQGIASIENKSFHSLGGSIYSLHRDKILPFITSFQTISDYLDNLCDRSPFIEERAFFHLHHAILDSLDPGSSIKDYYQFYPFKNDDGYLNKLVNNCKKVVSSLPSYHQVQEGVIKFGSFYRDLQVYKHLELTVRETKLKGWYKDNESMTYNLNWWEFAAATGSTLPVFALIREACKKNIAPSEIENLCRAYFPWISGLHILLDYFIDLKEDMETGDLNFVSYYQDLNHFKNRMELFIENSFNLVQPLGEKKLHQNIIKGLLALYLSDPKVKENNLQNIALELINFSGKDTKIMYQLCLFLRKLKVII